MHGVKTGYGDELQSFDVVLIEGAGDLVQFEKPQASKGALARVLAEQGLGPPPKGCLQAG